ncbi:MAG TPA: hypothetical protein VK308_16815 [Pyrinomonadaceae bacterium]|nr:hypothetical protein [Pyrinomonadaceae bacterium]
MSLIVFSLQINAQEKTFDESVLSENGKRAYRTLLKIELFAVGGIGYGGETSEGEKAFDILLEDKEAILAFKNLVKKGSLEGGMYGLFGLKMIDCDCFQSEFQSYKKEKLLKNNKEKFSMMSGCNSIKADNNSDKEFVIDYIVKNLSELAIRRQRLREHRKLTN